MRYRFLSLGSLFALVSIMLGMLANVAAPATLYAADTTKQVSEAEAFLSAPTGKVLSEAKGETQPGLYIVQLVDEPLATYKGGANNLAPTSPHVTGQAKVNVDAPASRAYRTYLAQRRAAAVSKVEKVVGAKVTPAYTYDVAYNGFAVTLTPAQAAQVAALPEVLRVQRDFERELHTDVGPQWIGAGQIWDGTATEMYVATILGAHEVPATNSTARGSADMTYDDATNTLSYTVQLTGITPSAAHIHSGAVGVNGPVVVGLTSTGPSSYAGSTVLSAANETLLRSGGLYLNFHTAAFPGGEIRGQVTGLKGEGMVVGVIDTGINTDHPSFAATGADGYTHVNPRGAGNYVGYCNPSNPFYSPTANLCNSKLIGVWGFPGTGNTPEDEDGHGSHTASTAAGNVVDNVVVNGYTVGRISGVAPHANVIAYNACCALSALIGAINQATADQVDVINYSIGSTASVDPWDDADSLAFLAAREGGVFVANSAGNAGPGANTVGSPADAPWLLTVGASTHNREYVNALINMTGGSTTPPANLFGKGMNGGTSGPRPIVDASKAPYNNPLCLPFPANTFTNEIVVCNRGQNGRVEKGLNVLNAGGDGMVLVNDLPNGVVLNGDSHVLPAVMISFNQGQTLRAWLNSGTGHQGTIRGAERVVDNAFGDRMAGFSSRGQNRALPGILKPDVTAPGVDIIAAYHTDGVTPAPEYNAISGTSMASPHAAGAAALIRQLHPDWTPAEVQSAMTMTGLRSVLKQDGVTPADPFDRGGGRIQVPAAANAGLLLDETNANYEAANPLSGGDPSTLNIATLATDQCLGLCTWERTFTSALNTPSTWTFSVATTTTLDVTMTPSSFTIPAGGTQTVVFSVDTSDAEPDQWIFGDITLSESNDLAPDASLPFAVTPTSGILPAAIEVVAHRNIGSERTPEFRTIATNSLTVDEYGLVAADELTDEVNQDSARGSIYDNINDGTVIKTVTVPAGAVRLVAETYDVEPVDVDLYVHLDANNDGIPTESEEVCSSATEAAEEYCDIANPDAGTYIIVAQNWQGTGNQPDLITVATGVVPAADQNNFDVIAPTSVGGNVPYTAEMRWNLGNAKAGDHFYGAIELSSSANGDGDLGLVPVDIIRGADEITKTVSAPQVSVGQYVTYTIRITNYDSVARTFNLTDTLPAGLTIDPASLTGGATYHAASNSVRWSGQISAPSSGYTFTDSRNGGPSWNYVDVASTNNVDELCSNPDFPADDGCDENALNLTLGGPFSIKYYDTNRTKVRIWTNGFLQFTDEPLSDDAYYYIAQNMPNTALPNSVFAGLWADMDLDGKDPTDAGGGKVYYNLLNGVNPDEPTVPYIAVQYKNVQQYDLPNSNLNFNIFVRADGLESELCAVYGPTLTGNLTTFGDKVSVGLENDAGTVGSMYYHSATPSTASRVPTPGSTICAVTEQGSPSTHTITFRAKVNAASTITNNVTLTTAGKYGQATSQAVFTAISNLKKVFMPFIKR